MKLPKMNPGKEGEGRVHSYYNIDREALKRNGEAGHLSAQRSAGTAERDPRDP